VATQQMLLNNLFMEYKIHQYISWYYTPMALAFTRHLKPLVVIYDCMDELSLFKGAPLAMKMSEAELFNWADLVFTGGQSLYEVKRNQHPNVHLFPSSIDVKHFAQARDLIEEPADQVAIPHPRLGFFGVIDERLDIDLLSNLAKARPDWHFVMIGPVVKIDPATLPRHENIYYLGPKAYQDLPGYLAGWDIALLLFARNDATRFISPTKTPEYLAGGKPVVSTSIRDVVHPYGEQGLVQIADTLPEFISAVEEILNWSASTSAEWLQQVDSCLAQKSWDRTWMDMRKLIEASLDAHNTEALDQQSLNGKPARLQTTLSQIPT
jgi:UDP-galactopyranose mutase